VPAYPALVVRDDAVDQDGFADPAPARAEHERGVRRLLLRATQDKVRQARKQLPVSPKLGLLYAAIESSERLRADIVDAAMNALLADGLADIRDKTQFDARAAELSKRLFEQAMQRLQLAEAILAAYAQVKPKLESALMGWARGNLDDIARHLRQLVHPGFLRETPAAFLAEFPRYLKALDLRADRAVTDPVKDQARLLELQPFADALAREQAKAAPLSEAWLEFQRDLEELRVQTFAQELGTRRPVSHKRLARQLEQLG
jgi:ATP-dependent helicase HrpA